MTDETAVDGLTSAEIDAEAGEELPGHDASPMSDRHEPIESFPTGGMERRRFLELAGLALVGGVVLAACGDGDKGRENRTGGDGEGMGRSSTRPPGAQS